jgi:PAS domain S-box-containing protein
MAFERQNAGEGPASALRSRLPQSLIDAFAAEVAVLDPAGNILMTNEAWNRFAREDPSRAVPPLRPGANYLTYLRAAGECSREILDGLEQVLNGARSHFILGYPDPAVSSSRHFLIQATRMDGPLRGDVLLSCRHFSEKPSVAPPPPTPAPSAPALEHSDLVVFHQDRGLRYTWINAPKLGWAATDYHGHTDAEIIPGPDGQHLTSIKRAVLESGVPTHVEVSVTFKGNTHFFDLNIVPMRDDRGVVTGIIGACTDITNIKRAASERDRIIKQLALAQRELQRRNRELEALHKEENSWLGMTAHDLRNPLSSILLNCEQLMLASERRDPDEMATLRSIESSIQFMLDLLDDVLAISVIETGSQALSPETADLRSLIEEAIALCRPAAEHKAVRIERQYPGQIPPVTCDRRKMTRVFLNLIDNAVKFSGRGGAVHVIVEAQPASVQITVRDHGPGFPPDEMGALFTPFHRSRKSESSPPGTGLGLALCKRIVERHGGRIWAANAPEGGAVLRVSLPVE